MGLRGVLGSVSLLVLAPLAVHAQVVIDNGTIAVGVNPAGNLITAGDPEGPGGPEIGITFIPTEGEALAPGCSCEGWGLGDLTTGSYGMAGEDFGFRGIASSTVTASGSGTLASSSGSSAVSVTNIVDAELDVLLTHRYSPSASPFLYTVGIEIENQGAADIGNLIFRRAMDWDVPPTEFDEFTTIQGWPATALIASSNDGFVDGNINEPLTLITTPGAVLNGNFNDAGPDDHGAAFDFSFGTLVAGETQEFSIFYGAAASEADAMLALGAVGAEVYSLGQPSSLDGATLGVPNTFIFGFAGVGGTPVDATGATAPINQFSNVASAFMGMRRAEADAAMAMGALAELMREPDRGQEKWNLHVTGTAGAGSYDETDNNVALDYTFGGISVAADTIMDDAVGGFDQAMVGASLALGRTSADLGVADEIGTLSGNSVDLMVYGRLSGGTPLFVEGVLNVARHNFNQDRNGALAVYSSDPNATSIGALVRLGTTRSLSEAARLSFYGELASTHTKVGSFNETTGGLATDGFSQTRSHAGLGLRLESARTTGERTDYARLDVAALARIGDGDYNAEQTTVGGAVISSLADGPDSTALRIRGTLGVIESDVVNGAIEYSGVLGSDGFRDHRLTARLNFEF